MILFLLQNQIYILCLLQSSSICTNLVIVVFVGCKIETVTVSIVLCIIFYPQLYVFYFTVLCFAVTVLSIAVFVMRNRFVKTTTKLA